MSNPFQSRSEMIAGDKNTKKKKKKAFIENLPDPYNVPTNVDSIDVPDGTSACPIYVSDFEDSSEIAVGGGYGYEDFVKRTLPVVARGRPTQPREPEPIFVEELPSQEKSTNKKKKRAEMKKRIAKMSSRSKSREKTPSHPVPIDVTALEQVPMTEEELEEIALSGRRSGLISGTPEKAAYDIENGKKLKPFKSLKNVTKKIKKVTWGKQKKRSSKYQDDDYDDEKQKSWFAGTLTKGNGMTNSVKKQNTNTKMVILVLCVLSVIIMSVGFAKSKGPRPGKKLSQKEEQIQAILLKITGDKTLLEPGTAQNKARNWLLFEDKMMKTAPVSSENGILQRYALACFFFATSGENRKSSWENNDWLHGPECGSDRYTPWNGINCNSDGDVRSLVFDNFGLSGTIPPEVGYISNLENLILKNNPELTGWIPKSLSNLSNLRQLGLYSNNLSGVIPGIFEGTKELTFINLEDNNIHGSIPLGISNLKSLETLVLKNNKMEGIIPFRQLSSTSIKYLGLSNNHFASRIEKEIADVDTLEHLYLDNNQLRGQINPGIGVLTNLKAIDLGNNSLTGFFPGTVGNLQRLEHLSVNHNEFTRFLPLRIAELTNLKTLNVASNQMTGTLPDLSDLSNLKSLHVYENKFSGPFPEWLEHLKSIESLFLSSNQFTGTIPESISLMGRGLKGLYLSDNDLEGPIPTHLCEFFNLEALFLDTNEFSGSIPACFGGLSKLQQLYLFNNKLSGAIPASLQGLKKLTDFGIESNDIVGAVPDAVCEVVKNQDVEMWADCGSSFLECPCCSVCCPGDSCI